MDFLLALPLPTDKKFEKYLCFCILRSYFSNFEQMDDIELPDSIKLLDLFKLMKDITGNRFFIIHFDEVQHLFTWKSQEERINSLLYHLISIIKDVILRQDEIVIILSFTGLNSTKMNLNLYLAPNVQIMI